MRFYLSHPSSRSAEESSLTVEQVRDALSIGRIQASQMLYPEDNSTGVTASSVTARDKKLPPPLPGAAPIPGVPHRQSGSPQKQRGSLLWLWIVLAIFGFFGLLIGAAIYAGFYIHEKTEIAIVSEVPLFEERKEHQTDWVENENYEADGEADFPDEELFEVVHYPSDGRDLVAYLTPDPEDGKKHPVLIWSKGGFGGIGDFLWDRPTRLDNQTANAYRDAGIVTMFPSYRGENDNEGKFELFYGEVSDFLAAVEYAKSLPYVDPERVYIGGHSTGGTIVLLAAASGVECQGIFAFGGAANMVTVMEDGEGYDNTPYDIESEQDHLLRSAIRYTKFIKSPTWYFEGALDDYYVRDALHMGRLAKRFEVPFEVLIIPEGDHYDILASTNQLIAKKIISNQKGENFNLLEPEVVEAWREMNDISLSSELSRWIDEGGELEAILDNLEDDREPYSEKEVLKIQEAVMYALGREDQENTDIAELAEIIDYTSGDDVNDAFIDNVGGQFREYIAGAFAKVERSEIIESNCMRILGSFILSGDSEMIPVVIQAAELEIGHGDDNWEYIFEEFSEEDSILGEQVLKAFRENPVNGVIGEALLDEVNNVLVKDGEALPFHPYNSDKGFDILKRMIEADGDATFHATLALAFIDEKYRKKLLPLVINHPTYSVRMEAAWADAKNGGEKGIEVLQEACQKVQHSETAKDYLEELGYEDRIPKAALEEEFVARVELFEWIDDHREVYGRPGRFELVDSRELYWPPSKGKKTVYLYSFAYRTEKDGEIYTSYGLGDDESAYSFFDDYPEGITIPNIYARHCAIEMRYAQRKKGEKLPEFKPARAMKLLNEKNPGAFDDLKPKKKKPKKKQPAEKPEPEGASKE